LLRYFSSQINGTTQKELAKILEQAVQEGKTSVSIAKDIKDTFDRWANGGDDMTVARSRMIARTEVEYITNTSMIENYRVNQVEGKEWLSARDKNVRTDHSVADGQKVPVNASFIVGGEQLDRPGDPAGSAGNVINCRCVVLPVLRL
jgi:uncharacterized protein with gpF-like domain